MNLTDILAVGGQLYYQVKRFKDAAAGFVTQTPVIHFDAFGREWEWGPAPLKCVRVKNQLTPGITSGTGTSGVTAING